MSSKVVPGYAPPTVTFSGNAMNVSIPQQPTPSKTGEMLMWTGLGIAALGLLVLGASKL